VAGYDRMKYYITETTLSIGKRLNLMLLKSGFNPGCRVKKTPPPNKTNPLAFVTAANFATQAGKISQKQH